MAMLLALLTTLIAQKGPGRPTVDITCVEGEQAAGDPSKISTATALTGAIGCTDPDAIAYRRTLPESIAGPPLTGGRGGTIDALATINIYGPFEAGFSSEQLSCLGSNKVQLCSTPDPQPYTNSNPKIAIYLSIWTRSRSRTRTHGWVGEGGRGGGAVQAVRLAGDGPPKAPRDNI